MGSQTPSRPDPFFNTEHAMQAPVHGLLQHTLSTQEPLPHWLSPVQVDPLPSLATHDPPWQKLPEAQSLSVPQEVRHAVPVPLHTYRPQPDVLPAEQVPLPLQVRAAVSVEPLQDAATHWVVEV